MQLSEIGEFGLIEMIRQKIDTLPLHGCEGIGDDCAVLPLDGTDSLVVTTDMLVEEVHFRRAYTSPLDLGHKSLAVNLSDVAAMGVAPFASFLSLALPAGMETDWLETFVEGYRALSARFGVALLGGDTTASPGALTINVTAIGRGKTTRIKRRSMAMCGDKILVTGVLGDSSKGLQDLMAGSVHSSFITAHNRPKPYVNEGIWLGEQSSVHAMMDVSDGVASDLVHILKASQCRAKLFIDKVPTNTSVYQALCGGEDYVLLFTAAAEATAALQKSYHEHFGTKLYEIGVIEAGGPEIDWYENGEKVTPNWKGFVHF